MSARISAATTTSAPASCARFNEFAVIVNRAVGRRILHERAENGLVEFESSEIADLDFDAERFRARLDDFDRLRMTVVRDEKRFSSARDRVTKRHRLGRGGRFIEQRSVGDIQRGQIGDHRLKIEQRFEPALRDLGLIRRVGRVPTGIFEDVALNHRRRDAIGVTRADKGARDFVFLRNRAQLGQRFGFRFRFRQIQLPIEPNIFRNGRIDQRVEIFEADLAQHFARFPLRSGRCGAAQSPSRIGDYRCRFAVAIVIS